MLYEHLTEGIGYSVPALVVFFAVYLVLVRFMRLHLNQQQAAVRIEEKKISLPLRLAAYERCVIFLERISPQSLIPRTNPAERISYLKYQGMILGEIRIEYDHIVSQQIYVSSEAWIFLKNAKEETVSLINQASAGMRQDSTNIEFSKAIYEISMTENYFPSLKALEFFRAEVQKIF